MFFKTFLILFLVGFIIIANNNLNRLEHEVCFFKKVCFYPVGQLDNFSEDDQKRQIGVGKKRKREEKKFVEARQKKERKQKDRELVQQYNEYSFLSTQKKKQGSLKCGLVIIDVDVDGNFYINYGDDRDRPLSAETLANRVVALLKSKDYMEYCYDTPFLVRGGVEIPYGLVAEAMGVLLKSGVVNIGIITKAERKKEREMEQKRNDTILKNVGKWFYSEWASGYK